MSRGYHIDKAIRRAAARERKRTPRMKVTGASVFSLGKLLRKKR
ncbi:MAG TPA: hypothetical protein VGH44_02575 [Candidatus Saccharimonadia bacterium]|jgi:hypothetical protein